MYRAPDKCTTGMPIFNIGRLIYMKERSRTEFGRRMLQARKAAGLTQVQVRAALGISQGTLSELEIEANSSGWTAQLAALYRCNARWLATGEGEPYISGREAQLVMLARTRLNPEEMALLTEVLSSDPALFVANLNKSRKPSVIPGSHERALEEAMQVDISNPGRATDGGSKGAPDTSATGSQTRKPRRDK
jgi:transcriptional regulator with XRE-family HTH domain